MDNNLLSTEDDEISKKWYQTLGGRLFLGILSLALLAVLFFLSVFSYYLWQVRYGDPEALNEQITKEGESLLKISSTTVQTSRTITPKAVVPDYKKYVRSHNPSIGKNNASITVLMFIDFECPYCRQSYPIFKAVSAKYNSLLKVVFKHLPIGDSHPNAFVSALASTCAEEKGKFWEYYNLLFIKQNLDRESLLKEADVLGLDRDEFINCLDTEKYKEDINDDLIDAASLDLTGTPSFVVNGEVYEGVLTAEEWDKLFLKFLNAKK